MSKGAWIAIVIIVPVLGGILWFTLGRARNAGASMPPFVAPDDDPEFLRRIAQAEADARIARLEEELARLDEEGDGEAEPQR